MSTFYRSSGAVTSAPGITFGAVGTVVTEWRKELTELYNTVNRAWLARKSLPFVLIGCGHIEGVTGEPVEEREQSAHERLRDEVLRSVNISMASYL